MPPTVAIRFWSGKIRTCIVGPAEPKRRRRQAVTALQGGCAADGPSWSAVASNARHRFPSPWQVRDDSRPQKVRTRNSRFCATKAPSPLRFAGALSRRLRRRWRALECGGKQRATPLSVGTARNADLRKSAGRRRHGGLPLSRLAMISVRPPGRCRTGSRRGPDGCR
jgi:hypothetical protein